MYEPTLFVDTVKICRFSAQFESSLEIFLGPFHYAIHPEQSKICRPLTHKEFFIVLSLLFPSYCAQAFGLFCPARFISCYRTRELTVCTHPSTPRGNYARVALRSQKLKFGDEARGGAGGGRVDWMLIVHGCDNLNPSNKAAGYSRTSDNETKIRYSFSC